MSTTVTIFGPRRGAGSTTETLWKATAEVLSTPKYADEAESALLADAGFPSLRALFLGEFPSSDFSVFRQDPVLVPGTVVALCRILTVTVKAGAKQFTWRGGTAFGSVALVLQSEPADWVQLHEPGEFPAATLLAGEIPVAGLVADASNPPLTSLAPGLGDLQEVVFHASGFAFRARPVLPWEAPNPVPISPWLALFPFPEAEQDELRIELDRGRLDAATTAAWAGEFEALRRVLAGSPTGAPLWARLELTPAAIPKFSWKVRRGVLHAPDFRLDPGEVRLLLSQAGSPGAPTLSAPAVVEIPLRARGTTISLNVKSTGTVKSPATGAWTYRLTKQDPEAAATMQETVQIAGSETYYDAISLADRLRRQLGSPAPEVADEPPAAPLLWAGVRLEEGWAQLPFFNVTEEGYLATEAKPPPPPPTVVEQVFRGAALFGNDVPDLLPTTTGEQPWSVTLMDAASFQGTWELPRRDPASISPPAFKDWPKNPITLTLPQPELILDGLVWLGTEAPSAVDALPSLDNWVGGLQSLPLRTADPADRYPSPHVLRFPELQFSRSLAGPARGQKAEPELGVWRFGLAANPDSYERLVRQFLHWDAQRNDFLRHLPLIWRRHPRMPCVQAIPLTQKLQPPSYPSPSRELAPFELPLLAPAAAGSPPTPDPAVWEFGIRPGEGARVWPSALQPLAAAKIWRTRPVESAPPEAMPELALASLSMPGVVLDPTLPASLIDESSNFPAGTPGFLPLQYRFDLPYTDEINALAELPRDDAEPPLQIPSPPPPLFREDFAAWWQQLQTKGLLATADAANALVLKGGKTMVTGLIEPFSWNVAATVDQTIYPGSLTLKDAADSLTLDAQDGSLLRGIDGTFTEAGGALTLAADGTANAYRIVAGSMSARVQDGSLRDQRGLLRAPTQISGSVPALLKTPVRREATDAQPITLFSLLAPLELPAGDRTWRFWMRDVPGIETAAGHEFTRKLAQSKLAEDANDPGATTAPKVHLSGYEWRLGDSAPLSDAEAGAASVLQLLGLHVFPLALERVTFSAADVVSEIVVSARLQLPRSTAVELTGLQNAVLLRFARVGTKLQLVEVTVPVGGECVWQLADDEMAPVLRLEKLIFKDAKLSLFGKLHFSWLNALWLVPIDELTPPVLDGVAAMVAIPLKITPPAGAAVFVKKIDLALAVSAAKQSSLAPTLSFRWGEPKRDLSFAAERTDPLLPAGSVPLVTARLENLDAHFPVEISPLPGTGGILATQLAWQLDPATAPADGSTPPSHALPGVQLSQEAASGFAAVAFTVTAAVGDALPTLALTAAAFEGLFPCRWNRAGQALAPEDTTPDDLFHSSAGDLVVNYTLQAALSGKPEAPTVDWQPQLLLNGWLEVLNLISWPANAPFTPAEQLGVVDHFASADDAIPASAQPLLRSVATKIIAHPEWVVHLEGHADIEAPDGRTTNLTFARRRAEAVRKALVALGVPRERLIAVAYGDTRQHDAGQDAGALARNRRVEMRREAAVVLPAVRDPQDTLNHLRHSLRILLNQHTLAAPGDPKELILSGGAGGSLFGLKGAWQFLAVVEHRIVNVALKPLAARPAAVAEAPVIEALLQDRRWSVVQEVRLASPAGFRKFLAALQTFFALDVQSLHPVRLPEAVNGYAKTALLRLLLGTAAAPGEIEKLQNALLVEASAPFWLRPGTDTTGHFTALQFLPSGAQRGVVTRLGDLDARPAGTSAPWFLLTLPFLGRLQDATADRWPGNAAAAAASQLQLDPILALHATRQTAGAALHPVPLAFTSRQSAKPLVIGISDADVLGSRRAERLDPATLIEAWFRLQNPPREDEALSGLAPIMAALPANSPGRLSRHAALDQACSALRTSLPPRASTDAVVPDGPPAPHEGLLVWRHLSLLATQGISNLRGGSNAEVAVQGFFFGGLQLQSLRDLHPDPGAQTHPAVTAIPANLSFAAKAGRVLNRQPVSFAISPYAGLTFDPAPDGAPGAESLIVAELLALSADGFAPKLTALANQIWLQDTLSATPIASDALIRLWAAETCSRLAADSPLAIVRVRSAVLRGDGQTDLLSRFRFLLIDVAAPPNLAPLTRPLRATPARLHFHEGQYNGHWIPEDLLPFEVAPPQTAGVLPLWFLSMPDEAGKADARPLPLSALRLSVRHYAAATSGESGVVGPIGDAKNPGKLWWVAAAHRVAFAVPERERLLPPLFRAPAIESLLPAPAHAPLPAQSELRLEAPAPVAPASALDRFASWQPLLADAYRFVLIGGRAGVHFYFRNHLITQFPEADGAARTRGVASGSVPVQHRFPRPLPLPRNGERGVALAAAQQPWPALFLATQLPEGRRQPADNATFDTSPMDDANAHALEITLQSPADGTLLLGSAGRMTLRARYFARSGTEWKEVPPPATEAARFAIEIELKAGNLRVPYLPIKTTEPALAETPIALAKDDQAAAQLLSAALGALPHGTPLTLELRVSPPVPATGIKGYFQTLQFPLRLVRTGIRLLPLVPAVLQFEDPEYNRRLASTPAQQTGLLVEPDALGVLQQITVLLASDRREYNPTTPLFVAFITPGLGSAIPPLKRSLLLRRVDQSGAVTEFPVRPNVPSGELQTFRLGELPQLVPGDALEIALLEPLQAGEKKPKEAVVLRVDIVARPVIPTPDAAYALLRREGTDLDERVHCARFAWSPLPERIELLDPNDLADKIVRRRAVFQWLDSIRPLAVEKDHASHRVQKINFHGGTHFPVWKNDENPL